MRQLRKLITADDAKMRQKCVFASTSPYSFVESRKPPITIADNSILLYVYFRLIKYIDCHKKMLSKFYHNNKTSF